jgi:H+-transporting ATPase
LTAKVLRDGIWTTKPSREVVPGDVVRLRLGDIVPADVKLFAGDYLLVDESMLTGESLPVEKHAGDSAYSGSVIKMGEINGLVTATGKKTFFGKTTQLMEEAKTSHFQKAVVKIGDYLMVIAIFLVAIVFLAGLFRHESFAELLQFSLVLVVAAIPAALPVVLSVTMAVGASELAKREAVVRKLVSIEEMAGNDILCSDKTGTITKNELTIADLKPEGEYRTEDLLVCGVMASREEDNDPIDSAIISESKNRDATCLLLKDCRRISFKPFDPVSKKTQAEYSDATGAIRRTAKGAPQVIMSLTGCCDAQKKNSDDICREYASRGYRTLAVAKTDASGKWMLVGFIALYDPPRDDSAETIKTAKGMGVQVKMITGDHIAIAKEIARRVSLGTNIMQASEFEKKSDVEALRMIIESDGFAEVYPEHKHRIVELLQGAGHIVVMTGDGVNDVPALKKADVGIAVANATDAAKMSADLVLTKKGLSVIVDAERESRKIFQRMTSYATYRIAETIRILLFLTLTILIFNIYPISAIMIVLLAILNDGPIMMIAYDNAHASDKPLRWDMRKMMTLAAVLGVMGVLSSFLLFWIGLEFLKLDTATLQTLIFLKMAVAGHLTIYLARTGEKHFWEKPFPAPILIAATEGTQIIATIFAVYGIFMAPIGWNLAIVIWLYSTAFFLINDQVKIKIYRLANHAGIRFRR